MNMKEKVMINIQLTGQQIMIGNETLEKEEYTYFGRHLVQAQTPKNKSDTGMGLSAFGILYNFIIINQTLSVKVKVYNQYILPVLT